MTEAWSHLPVPSGGALLALERAMIYEQNERDAVLDQKRFKMEERLARETRVGWPTLDVILIVAGT